MSENDYIAEYVKEKYPNLLGINYAFWRTGRMFKELANDMGNVLKNLFCENKKNEAEFIFDETLTEEGEENE